MNPIIVQAIKSYRYLEFTYQNHDRYVEPHTYGASSRGKKLLRAWQESGGSRKGGIPDWRLFDLSEVHNLRISDATFLKPRFGYKEGDSVMKLIYAELRPMPDLGPALLPVPQARATE